MTSFALKFLVNSTDYRCPFKFSVSLNGTTVHTCEHIKEAIPIEVIINDTEQQYVHALVLTLEGKNYTHTQLKDGVIIVDPLVTISHVTIDDIRIDQVFNKHSTYRHNANNTKIKDNYDFFGIMGCNGTVTFTFSTPIFHWLLENS